MFRASDLRFRVPTSCRGRIPHSVEHFGCTDRGVLLGILSDGEGGTDVSVWLGRAWVGNAMVSYVMLIDFCITQF